MGLKAPDGKLIAGELSASRRRSRARAAGPNRRRTRAKNCGVERKSSVRSISRLRDGSSLIVSEERRRSDRGLRRAVSLRLGGRGHDRAGSDPADCGSARSFWAGNPFDAPRPPIG